MTAPVLEPRTFRAFISYRHLDNRGEGRRWAEWLQNSLESYAVPEELRRQRRRSGQTLPENLYPIFRDEEELAPGGRLGQAIDDALQRSEWLVVLCSPRSAVSPWVNAEVRRFQELGKGHRILPVLIDGEPNASLVGDKASGTGAPVECLPEALRSMAGSGSGPLDLKTFLGGLAADFRPEGLALQGFTSAAAYREALERENDATLPERRLSRAELRAREVRYADRLKRMRLKICAGILGVDLGELTRRDAEARVRRARRNSLIASAVAVLLLGLLVWALYGQWEARRRGFISLARALAAEAPRLQGQERMDEVAALLARQAFLFNERHGGEALAQVDAALRSVLSVSNFSRLRPGVGGAYNAVVGATNGWRWVHGSPNRTTGTWDWNPRRAPEPIQTAVLSNGPAFVASAVSGDGNTRMVATESGQLWRFSPSPQPVTNLPLPTLGGLPTRIVLDGPGRQLAAGLYGGDLTLVRWDAKNPSIETLASSGQVTAVAFSVNDAFLVWGTVEGRVFRTPTTGFPSKAGPLQPLAEWGTSVSISAVACGPEEQLAVSGWWREPFRADDDLHAPTPQRAGSKPSLNPLRILDARTGEVRVDLGPADFWANALAFSPTGRYLAAGTTRGDARIWDLEDRTQPLLVIEGHRGEVNAVAWLPDASALASLDNYGNLRVSRVSRPLVSPTLEFANPVLALTVQPGTEEVWVVESRGALIRWSPSSGEVHRPPPSSWDTKAAAIDPSGRIVALAAGHQNPGQGIQWRTTEGSPLAGGAPRGGPAWSECVGFLADGSCIAGAENEIWRFPPDQREPQVVRVTGGWVRCLATDPTGATLASASDDRHVRLWRIGGSGLEPAEAFSTTHDSRVTSLALNGRHEVAVGFGNGVLAVFRKNGVLRWSASDNRGAVTSLAFLGDDDRLASGGENGVVRLYRLQTGHAPITLRAEAGSVNALAWRPNAFELVAGYSKGRAIAWKVDTAAMARMACDFAGRDLTKVEWNRFIGPSVVYERGCGTLGPGVPGK